MTKKTYFETTDLKLAIFLYLNNKQVIGINPTKEGQKKFTFIRTDSIEKLEYLYKFGEKDDERLTVSIHKYEQARRELINKLNN